VNATAPPPEVAARLDSAIRFARQAGESTLPVFERWRNAEVLSLESKDDGSPVTRADKHAESLLRDLISRQFPGDAILGEEFGLQSGTTGFRWVLDPIDGTASFMRGVPLYGTMVGVEFLNQTVAGVIEFPALGERIWGAPTVGALHQVADAPPQEARVSTVATLAHACIATTSPQYFSRAGKPHLFHTLEQSFGTVRGWSDCYAFLLLATGRIDAAVEPLVKVWDLAAAQAVVEAAGGTFTDLDGVTGSAGGSCLATNGFLHAEALRALACAPSCPASPDGANQPARRHNFFAK